ncbi:MAG: hypothetical protein VW878_06880, partial [Candidatus Poseidoniales archaeon]
SIGLSISVLKCCFDRGQKLIVHLSGGQFNSFLKNFKTDANEFLSKFFVVRKFCYSLMNNGGSEW